MKLLGLVVVLLAAGASPALTRADGCPLPCSGQSASPPDAKLLFVQAEGAGGPLVAYDTTTGRRRFALPPGRASADGSRYFTAATRRGDTLLSEFSVATGASIRGQWVRGRWMLAGVSPSGRWLALARRGASRTRLQIVDANRGGVAHLLDLAGSFEVETVSADGKRLFLIEHLSSSGAPRYLVRLYDLSRETLVANPLRAKGEDKVMAGLAWSGIASPNGRWLLTLYLNTRRNQAFVHALDLRHSQPVCIDLPSGDGSLAALKQYALKLSPDGSTLYAANAALGVVAEIGLGQRRVVRSVHFARSSWRGAAGPGANATISRNGRTLYFTGGRDLWAYDAAYGVVRGAYRTKGLVAGLGFGHGDRRVHVARGDGRMLAFEAATGRSVRS
jgi:hypothetical protein